MSDQYREPIEEDIDLRAKFVGVAKRMDKPATGRLQERGQEKISAEKSSTYNKLLSHVKKTAKKNDTSNHHVHTIVSDAHRSIAEPDVESQVARLISLATTKGVVHAVKVAQHMSDFYILDTMHDKMLADKFFEELNKKNLL